MQQADLIQAVAELIVEEVPQVQVRCNSDSITLLIQGIYAGIVYLVEDVLEYHCRRYQNDFRLSDPNCFYQLGRSIVENFERFQANNATS